MRPDEAVVRRWRDDDASFGPLGRLLVATAWDRPRGREKRVKTERPREVPVHASLARILAEWKLAGWQRMIGRAPGADDLIIPSREGRVRNIVLTQPDAASRSNPIA